MFARINRWLLLGSVVFALGACGDQQGPAESAGERVDETAEEVQEGFEEAGEEAQETVEEVREEAE